MSSARKRAYKHKAYAEIDHLKQQLMLKSYHYDSMLAINEALAKVGDDARAENALLIRDLTNLREQKESIWREMVLVESKCDRLHEALKEASIIKRALIKRRQLEWPGTDQQRNIDEEFPILTEVLNELNKL